MPYTLWLLLAVLSAVCLDAWLGEPRRWHPLVLFAHWATRCQRICCPPFVIARPRWGRLVGALALLCALSPLLVIAWLLQSAAQLSPWLSGVAAVWILYSCIGWCSLQAHVVAVNNALTAGDTVAARQRLSWIVSRDTEHLNATQIAQANLETLLENSADALFASLFWFVVAGPVGALLHRWVNTLDAMWGYKTAQWRYVGWAAARADDVLNWLPARAVGLLFLLVAGMRQGWAASRRGWHCWRQQAAQCASPNGGVVMCVGAGVLNVRLSDGAYYHGQWQAKPPMGQGAAADGATLLQGIRLIRDTLWMSMLLLGLISMGCLWIAGG